MPLHFPRIGIIGAGAMGRGIAQLCAQAGADVALHDQRSDLTAQALHDVNEQWMRMVQRERLTPERHEELRRRIAPAPGLADLTDCNLVVEAVVEDEAVKKNLFATLESLLSPATVLVSNTSSLSITALASGLRHPDRFAGLHFFNPAPVMRLVEVVAGLRTASRTCEILLDFVRQIGHEPVLARDTPGFIVNHAGRAFVTEALRIAGENVADFATIDRILREQAGFRLGPFELLDLTGLDVSHPVMVSLHSQYFAEPRLRPSAITARRLAAGLLGRKCGEGFYRHVNGQQQTPPEPPAPSDAAPRPVWVSPRAARRSELLALLHDLGAELDSGTAPSADALCIVAPLGLDVTTVAVLERLDPARTLGIDLLVPDATTRRRVLATNPATRADVRASAHRLFARDGKPVSMIRDSAGFVTQRVLAAIVNIGADICQQGICTPADLDLAVRLGLGYPEGPLALGDRCGPANVLEVLMNMQAVLGDPRDRPSPWLRRRAALNLSLLHPEVA